MPPIIILVRFSAFKTSGWRIDKHYSGQDGKLISGIFKVKIAEKYVMVLFLIALHKAKNIL